MKALLTILVKWVITPMLWIVLGSVQADELAPNPSDKPPEDPKTGWCLNPEINRNWGQLITKSLHDPAIVRLFALRNGLCQMLENGMIEKDFAAGLWNEAHEWELEQRRKEEEQRKRENEDTAS